MAVVAPAALHAQGVEGDVELVVDGDDPLDGDLVELRQRGDRAAGLVHVAAGPGEHDPGAARTTEAALDDVGAPALVGPEAGTQPGGQLVVDEVADVVPVPGIGRAGVPETDDQPHVLRHRFLSGTPGQPSRHCVPDCVPHGHSA